MDDLSILNGALIASPFATPYCIDVIRAYTCNYVYPGCNNETNLPQGICREECERYVLTDICSSEFNSLVRATESTGRSIFIRQCENTLLHLQGHDINSEDFDHCDCINITGEHQLT